MMAATLPHLGRVDDMPHATYLAAPGVSNSALKALRRSPWHFKMTMERNANDAPRPADASTPAQFAGTLAHCALLEPTQFDARYPVGPEGSRASKAFKDFARSLAPDAIPITPAQATTAHAQAQTLRALPSLAPLFAHEHVNECSMFWNDPATQILCKGRPDRVIFTPSGVILLDVKTAVDASQAGFSNACARFEYDYQAAWYLRGWVAATGVAPLGMVFAVVESLWPWGANAYMLADLDLTHADYVLDANLRLIAQCEAVHNWPGYPDGLQYPLALPPWSQRLRAEQASGHGYDEVYA